MITQAIIPLAGLGTRMLPFTKVIPKELLPLGNMSILERVLIECEEAGIKKIYLIISKKKDIIKKYFENNVFLKKKIFKNKNLLNKLKKLDKFRKKIRFVYQNSPKGLGDAVLTCKNKITSKYFLLFLPDDIIINSNCTKELISVHKKNKSSVIAIKKVLKKNVNRYGIAGFDKKNKNILHINKLIEKPSINSAPSLHAIIGRYILDKDIFKFMSVAKKGKLGEIQITDTLNKMLHQGRVLNGCVFKGEYLDCGTMEGYIKSFNKISNI